MDTLRRYLLFLTLTIAAPLWGQAPGALTVKSATNKQVVLSWSGIGSSYTVQRAALGSAFTTIATVSTTTYTDSSIDAYTAYQYQVLNGTAASGSVKVGPPPAGLSIVAPAPIVGASPSGSYGEDLAVAQDSNGDPAVAFLWLDPKNDGSNQTQVIFRCWNRAQNAWNPVVSVATVGNIDANGSSVALAYDSSTATWAVAAPDVTANLRLYTSPDGAVWTLKNTFGDPQHEEDYVSGSMALAGGNIFLAIAVDPKGIEYVTGKLSAAPSTWTTKTAVLPSGIDRVFAGTPVSLALDSAGNPGIAYWSEDANTGYNDILLYWRPASSPGPVKVMDTQGNQSDYLDVKMSYFGLNPRVLVECERNDSTEFDDKVHLVRSNDGGATWTTPALIPADGHASTDAPFALGIDSQDHATVSFTVNGAYGDGSEKCGQPKVSTSSDLVNWYTCDLTNNTGIFAKYYTESIGVLIQGNDKRYLLWRENDGNNQTDTAILMYREPPPGASAAPQVSGVVDGASFRANIVAGSWVTITGANLASVSRIWQDSDFTSGAALPTNLSGTSVTINGLNAAVYYISPTQVNVQAPASINGSVPVKVTVNGVTSNSVTGAAVANAPSLFSYSAGSSVFPAAVFASGAIVGDPAVVGGTVKPKAGDVIELYATGLSTSPAGNIISAPIALSSTLTATVGTTNAVVQFAGLVAVGEFQINIIVPNLAPGNYPLTISVAGQTSQAGVTLPIGQ